MGTGSYSGCSDQQLVQIVDAALLEAKSKSGSWLVCQSGCAQCCVGVFAINQLDAARLRAGLAALLLHDPDRALRVRARVAASLQEIAAGFPGDPLTGILGDSPEEAEAFESFANDEVCPALDRESRSCDLYSSRPMTCRVFGPPVRTEDGLGVCELCYQDASPEEIASCEMIPDPDGFEAELVRAAEALSGINGQTIVAFALAASPA